MSDGYEDEDYFFYALDRETQENVHKIKNEMLGFGAH